MKKFIGIFLNFLCAFIIFSLIIACIGLFVITDNNAKQMMGNYNSALFSYEQTDYNIAEMIVFGEKIVIDYDKVDGVKNKVYEIASLNRQFVPSIFGFGTDSVKNCFKSVSKSFEKVPDILSHFIKK